MNTTSISIIRGQQTTMSLGAYRQQLKVALGAAVKDTKDPDGRIQIYGVSADEKATQAMFEEQVDPVLGARVLVMAEVLKELCEAELSSSVIGRQIREQLDVLGFDLKLVTGISLKKQPTRSGRKSSRRPSKDQVPVEENGKGTQDVTA